jgi:hypothetical protein
LPQVSEFGVLTGDALGEFGVAGLAAANPDDDVGGLTT